MGLGSGLFKRECKSLYACDILNCHRCDNTTNTCTMCRNSKFLLNGTCVDDCPEGDYIATGSGSFGNACEKLVSACDTTMDQCYQCSEDNTKCLQCKNSYFLYEGDCLATCPDGTKPAGGGRFNRFCLLAVTDLF